MGWISIISAVLSFVRWMIEEGQKRQWITEGEDREIARNLAATLELTRASKKALAEMGKLSDAELDEFLQSLERKPSAGDK